VLDGALAERAGVRVSALLYGDDLDGIPEVDQKEERILLHAGEVLELGIAP
jgi:hypothetical protein